MTLRSRFRPSAVARLVLSCLALPLVAFAQIPQASASSAGGADGAAMAAQLSASASGAGGPQVIALMAAVGDRITLVKQKRGIGSHMDPYVRQTVPLPGPSLNDAVLKGLDDGIARDVPGAQRVLLRWTAPAHLQTRMDSLPAHQRDEAMLTAILDYLRPLPQRQGWDRVELIVPKYSRSGSNGMGTRLQGIGIYVQPLHRGLDVFDGSEGFSGGNEDGSGRKVINPRTGEVESASTYVAPYMYFERVTLDAKTLTVLARVAGFDATKYNDPDSGTNDVGLSIPPELLTEKLVYLAERSAFQSVRGKGGSVEVSTPVPAKMPAPAASAPR